MLSIQITPNGVLLEGRMFYDHKQLKELIEKLEQARTDLVEHQSRLAEEGFINLWEST